MKYEQIIITSKLSTLKKINKIKKNTFRDGTYPQYLEEVNLRRAEFSGNDVVSSQQITDYDDEVFLGEFQLGTPGITKLPK